MRASRVLSPSTMRLVALMVFGLVAAVWVLAVRDCVQQYQRFRVIQELVANNLAVDNLVLVGRDLIFERGRVNLRLAASSALDDESAAFIARLRRTAEHNLAAARPGLEPAVSAALDQRWNAVQEMRAEVDRQLALPLAQRDAGIRQRWFAVSTGFLDQLHATLHMLALSNSRFDPSFRLITRIKLMALALRDTLGEESSRIGATAAQGAPLTPALSHDLARLRGRGETQIAQLRLDVAVAGQPELPIALNRLDTALRERLRPLQDEILARALAGTPMTLPASSYSVVAVPVLEEVGRLFELAHQHSTAVAQSIAAEALRLMLWGLFLTVLSLFLGAGAMWLLSRRLLRPLFAIGVQLRALSSGYRDVAAQPGAGEDELDELRAVVTAFHDMLADRTALWRALPDLIVHKAGDGRWLGMNAEAERYLQVSAAQVQGKTDVLVAQHFAHLAPWLQQAAVGDVQMWRNGQAVTREEVLATPDGDVLFFQVVRIPLFHADGRRRGQLVVGRDVTDRRRAEAATARLSRQNQLILECAGEGIVGVDSDGRTIFFNPAASRMTGWGAPDVVGLPLHSIIHHSREDGTPHALGACPVTHTLRDGVARHCDQDVFWCKDGSSLAVEFSVNPLVEQERVRGAVIIFRDIRARLAAENEISSLLEELRRSNQELERFAYVASHDLRQPLRMINGYMSMLEKRLGERLDGDERTFLGFAVDGAKRMDRMIRDLLDYSRIGRDRQSERVELGQIIGLALSNLEAAIAEAGAEIKLSPALPTITGVRSELERLFQNLIANAIKFRDPDRAPVVEIGCRDDGACWALSVKDNGIGIAPEDHDRLFAIFQRLVSQERYDGTGIGLASVRKIAEHHGGRVWVESALGQGATFWVALPKGRGVEFGPVPRSD